MFSPDGQFLNFSTNPGSEFLSSGRQCLRKLPELRIAHPYRFIIPTASYLFSMRPKFHMIWHAVQRMKRTRIRANVFWTFCGEDELERRRQCARGCTRRRSASELYSVGFCNLPVTVRTTRCESQIMFHPTHMQYS